MCEKRDNLAKRRWCQPLSSSRVLLMNTYTEQRKNKKKKKKELVKCCCSKMFLPESEWEKGWWKGWSAQLANNKWSQAVAVNSKSVTATGNQCDQKLTITGKNSSSNERQSADSADTIDYYRASILYLSLLNDTQDRTSFICRQNTSCLLLFFLFSFLHHSLHFVATRQFIGKLSPL